jgi:hypothetical protein
VIGVQWLRGTPGPAIRQDSSILPPRMYAVVDRAEEIPLK